MKIFRFDPEVGKGIDHFNSSGFIISRVVQLFGEWHESGTETGMTVIIIEGVNFDPAKLMPLV